MLGPTRSVLGRSLGWPQALALGSALLCGLAGVAGADTVAAGRNFTLAVTDKGAMHGWGLQVGLGARTPTRVTGLPAAAKIFAGGHQVFAIDRQSVLWAWGDNGQGQLGDGTRIPRAKPVQVGDGYVTVSTNLAQTLAVKSDGSLWAWGNGLHGTLGNDAEYVVTSPLFIGSGYSAVAAGYQHSVGLKTDGSIWVWGRNDRGQLGTGCNAAGVKVPMPLGLTAKAIAVGYDHTLALQANGDLWVWGDNSWGQLGNSSFAVACKPVYIGPGYLAITAKGRASMALKSDGSLWIWGATAASNETSRALIVPTQIATGITAFAAGFDHGLAVRTNGQLQSFGSNRFGQVGDGTNTYRDLPVTVGSGGYTTVAASEYFSVSLKFDGSVWTWGDDYYGQVGNGPPGTDTTPVAVGTAYKAVAVGLDHRLALKTDNTLWSWGFAGADLGLGVVGHQVEPQMVGRGYMAIAAGGGHSLAVKTDGTLWVWGGNSLGQLGFDTAAEWEPVQLGSSRGNKYTAVAAGFNYSFALQADGSLWGWGDNADGQLGLGDLANRPAPVKIGTGFRSVAAGGFHTVGLKTDGSLWSWGANFSGQLGLSHFDDQLSPALVGTGYAKVVVGQNHTVALKTDGSLWVWGENAYFQLGNGTAVDSAVPVLLGTDIVDVGSGPSAEHALAVRRDGTVLIWGDNASGQLGDGTIATTSRPLNVVNAAATGPLTLITGAQGAAERLTFLLKLQKEGYDVKATLSDLRASGLQGEVYFTALLPKGSPLARCPIGATCSAGPSTATRVRPLRVGPTKGPLNSIHRAQPLDTGTGNTGMVAGVLARGGFKQTGGTSYTQADPAHTGDLGRTGTLGVYGGVGDALTGTSAVICMGVATPDMSAKGQVLMRPIATGTGVQGVVQCPPVQTASTIAQFRSEASGPITSRTIVAVIDPLPEDRGKTLKLFSWAVAPDGRQYMQTAPNVWESMTEPVQPVTTFTVPSTGTFRHEVTNAMNLTGLENTLVFIGLGNSWEEVRNFNRAGQHYTVQ